MNVLVFTSLWPNSEQPNFGIFVKNRIAAMAQLDDVNIRVIAPVPYFPRRLQSSFIPSHWRRPARIPDREMIAGIDTYHPRHLVTPKVGMTFYARWMANATQELLRRLHAEQPIDLIDAHYVYPDGYAAVMLGLKLNIPVVVTARGTDIDLFSRMPLIRPMIRKCLKSAKGVIAVSSALKERIVELGIEAEKVSVIRNGIDPEIFYPRDRAEARHRLGLKTEEKIIVSVGALVLLKGFDRLIDAMALIEDKRVKLYVIGEGPERAALGVRIAESDLKDRVFLIGPRPQEELAEWYSAADLFCLASRREGCPNVVIEAMACGAPVVAVDVGGIRELVGNESNGRIVVSHEAEKFAGEIERALEKKWDREGIAAYGCSRTWLVVAEDVFNYYAAITAVDGRSVPVTEIV